MATVVDDNSGLFQWNGQWASNNTVANRFGIAMALLSPKLNSTSHYSGTNGANCLIAWTGTDIAVYGARRSKHLALLPRRCPIPLPSTLKHRITSSSDSLTYQGIYGISVDNASPSYYSGFASPDEFQQVLYSTSGLSLGDHQIVISNANSQNTAQYPNYIYVDVDFVAVTGTLRDANNLGAATSTSSSIKQSSPSSASPSTSKPPAAAAAATTSSSSPASSSAAAASIASASVIPVSSTSTSASSTTGSATSVSPSAIAAAVATASGSSATAATATGQIQISGVGEYSAAQSSVVSASGSSAVTAITTGTPNTGDGGSEGNAAASEDSSSTTTHKHPEMDAARGDGICAEDRLGLLVAHHFLLPSGTDPGPSPPLASTLASDRLLAPL
ncbi:hypothetical protein JCM24511_01450 [Saitozyma sp. JCM 24511]|nr:hypothetical protein JCM24511_01450 [Saitozyma sp. JCM 24511]